MSTFLNRTAIVEGIRDIIRNANKEIILIVPYIKLSDIIFEALSYADNKGVEISIIYRELKLNKHERERLDSFKNLNLFSHSELHAKCYLNESLMIIASMNLYDYSEKYNIEMGVLIERFDFDDSYSDAIDEVRIVLKSAKIERKSARSAINGFRSSMLRSEYEKLIGPCNLINKHFDNKYFEVLYDGSSGEIKCNNYHEFMNVLFFLEDDDSMDLENEEFNIKRAGIELVWEEEIVREIHLCFNIKSIQSKFNCFKIYWKNYYNYFSIYRNFDVYPMWSKMGTVETVKKFKEGIDLFSNEIKLVERSLRCNR